MSKGRYEDEINEELKSLGLDAIVFYREELWKCDKLIPIYLVLFLNEEDCNLFQLSSKWGNMKCVQLSVNEKFYG